MFDMTLEQIFAWLITVPVLLERLGYFQKVPAQLKPMVVLALNTVIGIAVSTAKGMIDPQYLGQTIEQLVVAAVTAATITAIQFVIHEIEKWLRAKVKAAKFDAAWEERAAKGEPFGPAVLG